MAFSFFHTYSHFKLIRTYAIKRLGCTISIQSSSPLRYWHALCDKGGCFVFHNVCAPFASVPCLVEPQHDRCETASYSIKSRMGSSISGRSKGCLGDVIVQRRSALGARMRGEQKN